MMRFFTEKLHGGYELLGICDEKNIADIQPNLQSTKFHTW